MALTYTGTGGLFTRLGKVIGGIRTVNGARAETLPVGDGTGSGTPDAGATWGTNGPVAKDLKTIETDLWAQFASTNQQLLDGLGEAGAGYRDAQNTYLTYLAQLASDIVIKVVDDDAVLVSRDLTTALKELRRQMLSTNDSVDANAVSVAVSALSGNTTDAAFIASVVDQYGKNLENVFAETLEATVTDGEQTGATLGSEPISIVGEVSDADPLNWSYPDGSGSTATIAICDPTLDAQSDGNMLTNSGFEHFTANVPDDWTLLLGTAGTTVLKQVSLTYDGSGASLEFVGDGGSTLSSITQDITDQLEPNTVYAVCARVRKHASAAAGAVQFDLVNASNVNITDDASTANAITLAVGSISSADFSTTMSGFFRTPKVLPSAVKFRVRVSTAITDTRSIYIDQLAMTPATQLYPRGPFVACFRGATDAIKNDGWNITVSNDYAGLFQHYFDRLFDMKGKGLQLPSDAAAGETIVDTLIS